MIELRFELAQCAVRFLLVVNILTCFSFHLIFRCAALRHHICTSSKFQFYRILKMANDFYVFSFSRCFAVVFRKHAHTMSWEFNFSLFSRLFFGSLERPLTLPLQYVTPLLVHICRDLISRAAEQRLIFLLLMSRQSDYHYDIRFLNISFFALYFFFSSLFICGIRTILYSVHTNYSVLLFLGRISVTFRMCTLWTNKRRSILITANVMLTKKRSLFVPRWIPVLLLNNMCHTQIWRTIVNDKEKRDIISGNYTVIMTSFCNAIEANAIGDNSHSFRSSFSFDWCIVPKTFVDWYHTMIAFSFCHRINWQWQQNVDVVVSCALEGKLFLIVGFLFPSFLLNSDV